jgi:nucleotide-binding universal stress UspA family protein
VRAVSAYRTVVGTDGSESSLRAVARAGALAGAGEVRTVAVVGSPVEALLDVVRREDADLLVVGNRGLTSVKGRLPGSVPADATRRADCDVLVVHTTG